MFNSLEIGKQIFQVYFNNETLYESTKNRIFGHENEPLYLDIRAPKK